MSGSEMKQPQQRPRLWAGALAALLLVAGQAGVLSGHGVLGGLLSVLAVAVLLGGHLLASRVPAVAVAAPKGKAPIRGAKAAGKPAAVKAVAAPAAPRTDWKAAWRLFQGWQPLAVDELRLKRWWMLAPAALLLVVGQWGLLGGKTVLPIACLLGAGLIVAVFVQALDQELVIPELNANLRAVILAGLGAPLQLLGAWLMWQYVYEMTGFLLVVAGGSWTLWSLGRWPLRLALPQELEPVGDEWASRQPADFFAWPRWQPKAWLLLAAAVAAYASMFIFAASSQGISVSLAFLAMALLLASFPWLPAPLASVLGLPAALQPVLGLGLVLLAVACGFKGQGLIEGGRTTAGLWWFLSGGIAGVLAMSPRPMEGLRPEPEAQPPRWAELGLVLLLLAAAWAMHAWKIDIFPYAAEGDEAGGGVWGWDALHGTLENPLVSGNVPLQFYSVTAFFYKIMGLSMASMRMHSVVFGSLSIVAGYFFFRLFCGWAAALAGTLLMLGSYWHIHYSRFGHYNIEQVFAELVAFYFVFKGLRTGRHRLFVFAGVAFGLAMQPHLASRLLPFEGIAFVLFLFLNARDNLRRHATGLLVFVLAAWVVSSPSLMYWFRATGLSFGRASSVSIFDKTNSNAPPDVLAGFVRNSKVSMMMFNEAGDTRSRDNPLAPQKILETGTAVLFALAFAYALYHWREPARFFLLAVFFINLAASVFSVEAPQSLRTAGNIPVVFAFIALWLGDFSAGLAAFGRRLGLALFLALVLPLVLTFAWRSASKYFVERANLSFDVAPTYVAMEVGKVKDGPVKGILAATGFAVSHPPVILFKQGAEMQNFYNLAEFLPPAETPDKDLMLFLVDDYQAALPYMQSIFPGIEAKVIKDTSRMGGPDIAVFMRVPAKDIAARQGLHARALVDGHWVEAPNAGLDGKDPRFNGASRIQWDGALILKRYGRYRFLPQGKGRVQLSLDGRSHSLDKEAVLAMGVHSIHVEWSGADAADFQMQWASLPVARGMVFNVNNGGTEPLPKYQLWQDLKPRGFYGKYFTSSDFTGAPVVETVEPVLLAHWLDAPIQGNWSGTWKARFKAPQAGHYQFRPVVQAFSEVRVNGKLVARVGAPLKPELKAPTVANGIDLGTGWNTIEFRFATGGAPLIELHWSGPGLPDQVMQPATLEPLKD